MVVVKLFVVKVPCPDCAAGMHLQSVASGPFVESLTVCLLGIAAAPCCTSWCSSAAVPTMAQQRCLDIELDAAKVQPCAACCLCCMQYLSGGSCGSECVCVWKFYCYLPCASSC